MVILDWKMPNMSGVETLRKLRGLVNRNVPILITSAYDWSDIKDEAIAAGADGFISKPLFRSTLCDAIKTYVLGQTSAPAESKTSIQNSLLGRHLLLVEDNELNRTIAAELLAVTGAVIDCAENGRVACDKFAQSPTGFYDTILMDVQMPEMNGYEATRAIRAMNRLDAETTPILAMTADAFPEDVSTALHAGMNAHIAKPINVEEMMSVIHRLINH